MSCCDNGDSTRNFAISFEVLAAVSFHMTFESFAGLHSDCMRPLNFSRGVSLCANITDIFEKLRHGVGICLCCGAAFSQQFEFVFASYGHGCEKFSTPMDRDQ